MRGLSIPASVSKAAMMFGSPSRPMYVLPSAGICGAPDPPADAVGAGDEFEGDEAAAVMAGGVAMEDAAAAGGLPPSATAQITQIVTISAALATAVAASRC